MKRTNYEFYRIVSLRSAAYGATVFFKNELSNAKLYYDAMKLSRPTRNSKDKIVIRSALNNYYLATKELPDGKA